MAGILYPELSLKVLPRDMVVVNEVFVLYYKQNYNNVQYFSAQRLNNEDYVGGKSSK